MRIALVFFLSALLFACEKSKKDEAELRVNVKELVGIKGCPYCHDMKRPLLGPSFYDISRRYSEKDIDTLVKSILEGSKGKWGDNAMPPQRITEEEARIIVEWILNLRNGRE